MMDQPICDWQKTPDEILSEIAFYLKPGDRYNASLVCKNWCRVLKSSPVWFHRSFYLNGTEHDKVAIDYVAKYGHHLKSIRLEFVVSHYHKEIEVFQDNFLDFISSFSNSTSVNCLSVYSSYGASIDGSVFGEALAEFLKTQKDLAVFELTATHFNLPVPVLISILSALNKTSLCQLTLQKFTTLPGMLCSNNLYLDVIEQFTNIQSLSLRHDFVNNDVLRRVARANRMNWKKLVVSYSKLDTCDHCLSTEAWLDALEWSPNLKVTFNIEAKHDDVCDLAHFLLREGMPLLKMFINIDKDTPWEEPDEDEIKILCNELAEIYQTFLDGLEYIYLNFNSIRVIRKMENFFANLSDYPKVDSVLLAVGCDDEEFLNFCTKLGDSSAVIENLTLCIWPVTDHILDEINPILRNFYEKIRARGMKCHLYPMGIFDQEKYCQILSSL